jgi:hypothetical protein
MMIARLTIAVALAAAVALDCGALSPQIRKPAVPPTLYEDVGACPFEGCVYRAWTANATVSVRTDRRASAPVAFTVTKGEEVTAVTGVVVILKAGRVEFSRAVTMGTASGPLRVDPGQTLYLLTYRGEGFFKAWFQGRLYEELDGSTFFNGVCDYEPARCSGKIVERTQSTWWVQVRNRRRQTGWTSDVDKFNGKDLYGGAEGSRSNKRLHPTAARTDAPRPRVSRGR